MQYGQSHRVSCTVPGCAQGATVLGPQFVTVVPRGLAFRRSASPRALFLRAPAARSDGGPALSSVAVAGVPCPWVRGLAVRRLACGFFRFLGRASRRVRSPRLRACGFPRRSSGCRARRVPSVRAGSLTIAFRGRDALVDKRPHARGRRGRCARCRRGCPALRPARFGGARWRFNLGELTGASGRRPGQPEPFRAWGGLQPPGGLGDRAVLPAVARALICVRSRDSRDAPTRSSTSTARSTRPWGLGRAP